MRLFPFEKVREGQKKFIQDVELCVKEGRSLIANAPSGVGKTVASLVPALEYAIEHDKVVFFLTPRHSQHRIVIDTLKKIKTKFNVNIPSIDIIGKKWLCPVPGIEMLSTSDFNDYCSTVKKEEKCVFLNNTKSAGELTEKAKKIVEKILRNGPFHAEEIKSMCRGMCPYEIALEVAKKSRVIICDYYHMFSPARNAVLSRINRDLDDLILIVDEAHNLPDRIRNVLSNSISNRSLEMAEKEAKIFGFIDLSEKVGKINDVLKNLSRDIRPDEERYVKKEDFVDSVSKIDNYDTIIEELEAASINVREVRKKSYLGSLARFMDMWTGEDLGYTRIIRKDKRKDKARIQLKYSCLDPSIISKEIFHSVHSAILMSGTLSPMGMYKNVLGLKDGILMNKYQSYFPTENRLNLMVPDVTTQYTKRNNENYRKISDYIVRILNSIKGNMAVFFPSYEMRDEILSMVRGETEKKIFVERQDMNKEDKSKFFDEFIKSDDAVLFGAQSGSFSEGVDFFGGILKVVVIVGVALSKPDLETKALIDYYDYKFGKGWKYGYIYPAVNRALQAAGRGIRSEKDRSVIVFMDKRFLWKNYRVVFSTDFDFKITRRPEEWIRKFFSI